jgi:hypothetical protein
VRRKLDIHRTIFKQKSQTSGYPGSGINPAIVWLNILIVEAIVASQRLYFSASLAIIFLGSSMLKKRSFISLTTISGVFCSI